jgi:predicted ArsR family transcriptional regulator
MPVQRTSVEAYRSLDNEALAAKALKHIRDNCAHDGITADELAIAWRCTHNHAAPRLTHLKQHGQIVDSGERRMTRAGRTAIVWKLAGTARPKPIQTGLF